MPRKMMKGRRRPARKYGRKGVRRGGQRITTINKSLQPFPSRYICKMKYTESINSVGGPAGAGYGNYQFLLNSIYDPNATGVGHQPYGMDTLTSLYNRYRVIACSWNINGIVMDTAGVEKNGIIGTVVANEGLSVSGGVNEFQENPRSTYIHQFPGQEKVLKGKAYLPAVVGRTTAQYMADDRYQATTVTSPQENVVLNVYYGFLDGTLATAQADLNVTLEYTVEFFDVKKVLQS